MKRTTLIAVLLFAIALPVQAQMQGQTQRSMSLDVGPRFGIDAGDIEEWFIGGEARISSPRMRVILNPTFDFYLVDPGSFWSLSGNVLYPFGVENQSFIPYSGVGLGIYRFSNGGSSTDIGLNLLFGTEFPAGAISPFAEAQFSPVFTEGDTTTLFNVKVGLLLNL